MRISLFKIISIVLALLMVSSLTGCGIENSKLTWYNFKAKFDYQSSETIAENNKYKLNWDSETACVTMYDKVNNVSYSNIPNNARDYTSNPIVYSPIIVNYYEADTLNTKSLNAYVYSIKKDTYSTEKIKNGIKVTYYFKEVAISVPVEFVLRNDSLQVSINSCEIGEDTQICYSVSVMPFMCSVLNTSAKEENYLFVPSGSGALIYPKIVGDGNASVISQQIYGEDQTISSYPKTNKKSIAFPIFGAKNGKDAVFSIIENGDDNAELTTNVGSSSYAYSCVYPTFYLRGYQNTFLNVLNSFSTEKKVFCEGKTNTKFSIGYYPLSEKAADYNGMAEKYRNYLIEKYGLKKQSDDAIFNIEFIGGTCIQNYFFGIPYQSLLPTTTFSNVVSITNDLTKLLTEKNRININLKQFGVDGGNIKEIGSSFGYSNKFGNIKSLKKLSQNKNIDIYFNFDILRFSESGNGINKLTDVALSANGSKEYKWHTNIPFNEENYREHYFYVSRKNLNGLADKAFKKATKWNLSGVCLDTLSSLTYSDYKSSKYYAKSGNVTQTYEIFNQKRDLKIAGSSSNVFAAVASNHTFNTPTSSSQFLIYDYDIPFYQMVFKGYSSFSQESINLSENANTAFLKAVEVGSGLQYTLISKYDSKLIDTEENLYNSSVYSDNLDKIKENVSKYQNTFNKIKNCKIKKHMIISNDVRATLFDNGVLVCVNYGNDDVETEYGLIAAGGFNVMEVIE